MNPIRDLVSLAIIDLMAMRAEVLGAALFEHRHSARTVEIQKGIRAKRIKYQEAIIRRLFQTRHCKP